MASARSWGSAELGTTQGGACEPTEAFLLASCLCLPVAPSISGHF